MEFSSEDITMKMEAELRPSNPNILKQRSPISLGKKNILSGIAISYINIGLSMLISLVSSPLYIKYLGGELYGLWITLVGIVNYLSLSTNSLMITGAVLWSQAYAKREPEAMSRLAVTNSLVSFICAAFGVLILFCLIIFGVINPNVFSGSLRVVNTAIPILLILAICFLIASPLDVFRVAIRGSQRVDIEQGFAGVGKLLCFVSGSLVLVAGGGVIGFAYTTGVCTIVISGITMWWVQQNIPGIRFQLSLYTPQVARQLLSPSFHFLIISISGAIIWGTDNIVISIYLGAAAVTPFALTTQLQSLATSLVAAAVSALGPTISALHSLGEEQRLANVHLRLVKIGVATIAFLTIVLVTCGGDFLRLWVGSQYVISQPILTIITIIFLIRSIAMLFEIIIVGTMQHHTYAYMCLVEGIINLGLSILLVKSIGLAGVALGTLIAHVICTGWFIPFTAMRIAKYKLSEVVLRSIFPVVPALAFTVFCAGLGAVVLPHKGWIGFLAQVFALSGGFWMLFWRTGLSLGDRDLIKSALQAKFNR